MKRTATTLLIALGAAASLVLAACGGGGCNPCEEPAVETPKVDCAKTPEPCK